MESLRIQGESSIDKDQCVVLLSMCVPHGVGKTSTVNGKMWEYGNGSSPPGPSAAYLEGLLEEKENKEQFPS